MDNEVLVTNSLKMMEVVVVLSRAKKRREQTAVMEEGPAHSWCLDF